MAPRKPSMGRKKIEMMPIEIDESRQVTFSKRRLGLFRKASELSELCGVEVASVVFSPAGKAFSFGRPSVDAILNRLLADNAVPAPPVVPAVGGGGEGSSSSAPAAMAAELQELNTTYAELRAMVEQEKLRNGQRAPRLFLVGGSSSGANNGGFGNSLFQVGGSSSGFANNGGFGNSLFEVGVSSSGANNGGFHNSLFQVGGSSSGNNNGGFTGLFEVGGSSFRNNNGGTAMEDMQMQMDDDMLQQQLDTMAQLDPSDQIPPPPPPPGMGFPETMELPPLPAQLPPPRMVFPETMDLPPPDFVGPDGGFFGPPPY